MPSASERIATALTSGAFSRRRNASFRFMAGVPRLPGSASRPTGLRQPRGELQRIPEIELLQHIIRQIDSVELPERVIVAVVVEVLVGGFEDAPVVRILLGLERILSK